MRGVLVRAKARQAGSASSGDEGGSAPNSAKGDSRPAVATAPGPGMQAVETVTKRIYGNLGMQNRAMFTARMKSS